MLKDILLEDELNGLGRKVGLEYEESSHDAEKTPDIHLNRQGGAVTLRGSSLLQCFVAL
jgi:hypothetical protein